MPETTGEQSSAVETQADSVQNDDVQGESQTFIGEDGTFKEGWIDALVPEDLRHLGDYRAITNVSQLAKGFGHATALIGRQGKGIMPLAEDAGPTEKEAYYEALGRPKTASDYEIDVPEGMEELYSPETLEGPLQAMHELGLTQTQAQGLVAMDAARAQDAMTQRDAAQQTAYDDGIKSLKVEWGDAFDQKMHQANSVIEQGVPADKKEELIAKWGNDLDLVRALSKMGELLLEDTMPDAGGAGERASTPDELEAQAKELMQTPGYIDIRLPEATSRRLAKEISALYAKARAARKA